MLNLVLGCFRHPSPWLDQCRVHRPCAVVKGGEVHSVPQQFDQLWLASHLENTNIIKRIQIELNVGV